MNAYTRRGDPHRNIEVVAAVLIAALSIGPVIRIPVAERQLEISPASVLGILLAAHLFLSACMKLRRRYRSSTPDSASLLLQSSALLVLAVAIAPSFLSATAAFGNFITGVIIALFVARAWAHTDRSRIGPIDIGFVVFLIVSCAQLLLLFFLSSSASAFHAGDVTNWGGSNYVGGLLVVASFILLGRSREITSTSFWLLSTSAVGLGCAILTLSRSAIVALGAGAVILLWGAGQRSITQRNLFRIAAVISPLFTLLVYQTVNITRFTGTTSDGSPNIDARFSLFAMAWNEFLSSPIFGTGWTTLREVSSEQIGSPTSFAHNFFLSFLQIGGLLALPLFIYVISTWLVAISSGHPLAAATTAAIALSMAEPTFEGLIGATLSFACLEYISLTSVHRGRLPASIFLTHDRRAQSWRQERGLTTRRLSQPHKTQEDPRRHRGLAR